MKKLIIHRYRLTKDYKDGNVAVVDGETLYKKEWMTFESYQSKFKELIKSKINSDGILDYEEYDNMSQSIIFSSWESLTKKLKLTYTREVMLTMAVDEVNAIAKDFCMSTIKKRKEFLIDLIIKQQEKFKEMNLYINERSFQPTEKIDEVIEVDEIIPTIEKEKKKRFDFGLR